MRASPWSPRAIHSLAIRGCSTLSVTPDPGVIEVNVQPTRTWDELRDLTVDLYEQARRFT